MRLTTDITDITGLGSACGSHAGLKAWPLLRIRCSGALDETVFYSTTKTTEETKIGDPQVSQISAD